MATLLRQSTMSKDPQLEQDIERNLRLRDGAKRILSIAGNSIQRLDAEKTMLVSSARLVVSLRKLQQEKVLEANAAVSGCELSSSPSNSDPSIVGRAKLCLSGIRIPLLWRDNSVLMANSTMTLNKLCGFTATPSTVVGSLRSPSVGGDSSELSSDSYAAFCIVKVGHQIEETRLLCDILPGIADLEFDDVLNFEGVTAGFHCIIELYAYPRASSRISFLRRKSTLDYNSSWKRTTLFDSLSPVDIKEIVSSEDFSIMGTASTSSSFALVARYVASLNDISDTITAHTLDTASCLSHTMAFVTDQHSQAALRRDSSLKGSSPTFGAPSSSASSSAQPAGTHHSNFDESCEIPLFGPICFRLAAQPYSLEKPLHCGLLWIRALNVAPEQEAARLYDCQLKGQRLFARLIGPTERSFSVKTPDGSPAIAQRRQTHGPGHSNATKSPAKVRLRVPNRWNLILKIDPDTELLDEAPKPRLVLISPHSLTHAELNQLTSLPLKTSPTDKPKGNQSQAHQIVTTVTQANLSGDEPVPAKEQSNQGNVSPAKVGPVSERPPVVLQKQPGTGAESPTQNNFPATKPKKGNRTDEPKVKGSSESQAHQPVSSDGSVPQAQNDDKPETVPVEEQTTQGNVSPAKVDPVSEMPPVVSQKQSDADARSVTHNNLSVTKPENDSTSQQSGIRRSNKADSDLSPVKGEEHDTASSLKPVDPIISANADNVSPNDRNLKSFDRAEADDGDCVAQDFSQAVATNGMPKNTDKATAHADVHSDNPLPSTHSEGDHLQEAGMHNTSPPSKQACEDELDVGLGLPVASDEVALMHTRRASLEPTESDKSNQMSPRSGRSENPLDPSVCSTSPAHFLSRRRNSSYCTNKYARKKMVKILTQSLDRSLSMGCSSLAGGVAAAAASASPPSPGNPASEAGPTYCRRLSLPESESTFDSSHVTASVISRPDWSDSPEGGSKHDGAVVTQTTTDDAYQTGSENVSLLSELVLPPAAVPTTTTVDVNNDDRKEDSSALKTHRIDESGGEVNEDEEEEEEREKAESRSALKTSRTDESGGEVKEKTESRSALKTSRTDEDDGEEKEKAESRSALKTSRTAENNGEVKEKAESRSALKTSRTAENDGEVKEKAESRSALKTSRTDESGGEVKEKAESRSALKTSRTDESGVEVKEEAESRSVSGPQSTSAMPGTLLRRLATFHVATNPVSGPDASFNKSTMSEEDSLLKVVYEIAAFEVFARRTHEAEKEEGELTPTAMRVELGQEEEEDDEFSCGGSANAWFSAIQAHLKEQAEWGARVFNQAMTIAEATSFTKKGSIIRASAFLDNLNIPDFSLAPASTKPSTDFQTTAL